MGVLDWLESTSLAAWLQMSPSVWSLPTVLTLHTGGMAVLVGASWVLDLRLLGISRHVPLSAFRWVFPATWGTSIPFLIKMVLVGVSVATLVPLRSLVLSGDSDGREAAGNARLLAILSILAWTGAVTSGRLLAYLAP
jgi:hypothetical protein